MWNAPLTLLAATPAPCGERRAERRGKRWARGKARESWIWASAGGTSEVGLEVAELLRVRERLDVGVSVEGVGVSEAEGEIR